MNRMFRWSGVAVAISSAAAFASAEVESFGSFSTAVPETRLFGGSGSQLRCDLFFTMADSERWVAPKGSLVEQSVPAFVWQFSGLLPVGDYRKTLAVHSHYTDTQERSWEDVQEVLYNGLRAEGAREFEAKIAYAGAYAFAPRWTDVQLVDVADPTRDKHSVLYDVIYREPAPKGVSIDDYRALVRELMDDPERVTLQDIRGVVDAADAVKDGKPIVTAGLSAGAVTPAEVALPAALDRVGDSVEPTGVVVDLSGIEVDGQLIEKPVPEMEKPMTPTTLEQQQSVQPSGVEVPVVHPAQMDEQSRSIFPPETMPDSAGEGVWMELEDGSMVLKKVDEIIN